VSLSRKLRLVTVGCGYFSQFHHEAWQRLPVDHVGVCDLVPGRAQEFCHRYGVERAFTNYADMLDQLQPDLVDIILPPDQHLESISLAVECGAHVICQKPFTRNLTEAAAAVALAGDKQRFLVVHENFRFQPWYRKLKNLMVNEDNGSLYQVRFSLRPGDGQGSDAYLDRQPYFQTMEKFLIKETGIHFIDVFRYLVGEPEAVYADLYRLNPGISGEDAGVFMLEFADNVRAVFDGNRLADHPAQNRRLTMGEMLIETARWTFKLDGDGRLWQRSHGNNLWQKIGLGFSDKNFAGDCVFNLQQHVLDCIYNRRLPENHGLDYLRNLEIQQAVYQSSLQGRKIRLSSMNTAEVGN